MSTSPALQLTALAHMCCTSKREQSWASSCCPFPVQGWESSLFASKEACSFQVSSSSRWQGDSRLALHREEAGQRPGYHMHKELPWIWWQQGFSVFIREVGFPCIHQVSSALSQEKPEPATLCPGPYIPVKSPRAETMGLRGWCEGPALTQLPWRQPEGWRAMGRAA